MESINKQKFDTMLLVGGNILGAFIMFIWDYLAFTMSKTDE
jgi:hypothetical protein